MLRSLTIPRKAAERRRPRLTARLAPTRYSQARVLSGARPARISVVRRRYASWRRSSATSGSRVVRTRNAKTSSWWSVQAATTSRVRQRGAVRARGVDRLRGERSPDPRQMGRYARSRCFRAETEGVNGAGRRAERATGVSAGHRPRHRQTTTPARASRMSLEACLAGDRAQAGRLHKGVPGHPAPPATSRVPMASHRREEGSRGDVRDRSIWPTNAGKLPMGRWGSHPDRRPHPGGLRERRNRQPDNDRHADGCPRADGCPNALCRSDRVAVVRRDRLCEPHLRLRAGRPWEGWGPGRTCEGGCHRTPGG